MERKNLIEFLKNKERNLAVSYENVDVFSINGIRDTTLLKRINNVTIGRIEGISHFDKNVLFLGAGNRHFGAKMKDGFICVAQMLIGITLLDIRRIAHRKNFFIYDYENDTIVSICELCKGVPLDLIQDFDDYILNSPYSIQTSKT